MIPMNKCRHESLILHKIYRFALGWAMACAMLCAGRAADFKVMEDESSIRVVTSQYILRIEKSGFRYGFSRPTGEMIAPAHSV